MKQLKGLSLLAALAFIGVVFAAQGSVLADAPKDGLGLKASKGAVTFNHSKHAEECKTCHHKEKDGKTEVKCGECHKEKKEGDAVKAKKAFHDKCKGCHKDAVKKDPALDGKAPTKCKDCHKK